MRGLKNKTHEIGATMLEVMAVLAIIGLISVGAIQTYNKAMEKLRTSQIVSQAQKLMKDLSTYFSAYRVYPELTPEKLYKLGFLSEEVYNEDTHTAQHYFGGGILFNSHDGTMYAFRYDELPVNVCVAMATMDINVTNLYAIGINTPQGSLSGKKFPTEGEVYNPEKHLPYELGQAIKDCTDGATIKWIFL